MRNSEYQSVSRRGVARFFTRGAALCALMLMRPLPASALSTWSLPLEVSDSNTDVQFEVDSTWHLVKGKTSGVQGRISLSDPANPLSIHADISFPVNRFDTDNSSRDRKMRSVMAADVFPSVQLHIERAGPECPPERAAAEPACQGVLEGSLTIRGVSRELKLPYEISRRAGFFQVSGQFPFEWAAFGVEDPSILIAKLDPTVTVRFSLRIPETELRG